MRLFSLKVLIFIVLLIFVCQAQRGRGSRGGGGGRSRSYSSRSYSKLDGKGGKKSQTKGIGLLGLIIGIYGFVAFFKDKNQSKNKNKEKNIQNAFGIFQVQSSLQQCTLNKEQKQKLRDWFIEKKWKINFQTNNGSYQDTAEAFLLDMKPKQSFSYKISMKMTDKIGESKAEGILTHRTNRLGIIFQKTYANRRAAGQTGAFNLLLYEGTQQGDIFKGKWYYRGFQTNPKYSGTWEMFNSQN